MEPVAAGLTLIGAITWCLILLQPWRAWSTRERLEADPTLASSTLDDITVLVPARNEAAVIGGTLDGLAQQGPGLRVIVIDDDSTDGTAAAARSHPLPVERVIPGAPLADGWGGKLWALHQGLTVVDSPLVLLLDADIRLAPGMVATLRRRMEDADADLVSVMAHLPASTRWERLLLPAFVFFFKLLYPFRISNSSSQRVAAAAGGCILARAPALRSSGGFEPIRDALIDDCALARQFKGAGHRTWIGLTRSAASQRADASLREIWNMVARTAFTQLRYSVTLLALCTVVLAAAASAPILGLALGGGYSLLALAGTLAMAGSYVPTLRYYGYSPLWALTLPLAGALYLAMTWSSALRYWGGRRATWKGRTYAAGSSALRVGASS